MIKDSKLYSLFRQEAGLVVFEERIHEVAPYFCLYLIGLDGHTALPSPKGGSGMSSSPWVAKGPAKNWGYITVDKRWKDLKE